ncbi:MAG: GntR family transcriptional regulator [Oscillospiraceae bacterium]|jgi:GntR family transcriptional regulator of arabinose operon|nr:GntR family transcriptional regulator [Oscillospiraceae bacterium]
MPSKYVQIAALLRSKILEGAYQSTLRLPTEMELSETYQVNRQTVRRALAMLTQEGLIERHQGSGSYIRNPAPIHGKNIAILATYINDYIFPAILQDAQTIFARSGYSTLVFCTHNQVNMEREILKNILGSPVCGLLVEGTKSALPNPNLDLYNQLGKSHIPVVFLHGSYSALSDAVCISDDNFHGGYLLTQFLLKKGHAKIAGIFKSDDIQGHDRYFGFLSAFRDAGLPLPDANILWYTTEQKNQLLKHNDRTLLEDFVKNTMRGCSAVVCYNDEIAFSLINVLLSSGIRVPDDVAVVSFDNSSYSEFCSVKITSLAHGSKHIGRIAAERLADMLQGKKAQSESVPWVLVEKESS